jgi:uncharacterized protein YndB with AHSA1/START domain
VGYSQRQLVDTQKIWSIIFWSMDTFDPLQFEALIPASLDEVWNAWTTEEGVHSFFASDCCIEFHPGGKYEMYFNMEEKPGLRGGEGCVILAIDPKHMFSFTWNAPPEIPSVRMHHTHVTLRFTPTTNGQTQFQLTHDGWGVSPAWQEARRYFTRAWGEIVVPRLIQRFTTGPIK